MTDMNFFNQFSNMMDITFKLCLTILICTYYSLKPVKGIPIINDDWCVRYGGSCINHTDQCSGWIDTFDLSCSQTVCCRPAPSTRNPEPIQPNNDTCGIITRTSTPNPFSRIVGGDPALEGDWPWQVALVDTAGDIFCGGTLVNPEFVVTAAHCFNSYTEADIEVILGEHHLVYKTGNEIKRKVKRIVKHASYMPPSHADDIAFLQLDTTVDISGHYVRTACLPDQDLTWTPFDTCYVSGWGYTRNGDRDNRHLQYLKVNLMPNSNCKTAWGIHANITDNQLCSDTGATGTCMGDSGGPMVCLRNNKFYFVGVISFGHYTCTSSDYPDVFTSVSRYLDWMTSYMILLKASN